MTKKNWLHVILYQPEIPQNTGNIARLCAATDVMLHIIEPCGFILNNKGLKRAGLDYWHRINKKIHIDWQACLDYFATELNAFSKKDSLSQIQSLPIKPVSTMGYKLIDEMEFQLGDILLFGSENQGLPAEILDQWAENSICIPIWGEARSLNLSNAVSIVIYEAARRFSYRPNGFL